MAQVNYFSMKSNKLQEHSLSNSTKGSDQQPKFVMRGAPSAQHRSSQKQMMVQRISSNNHMQQMMPQIVPKNVVRMSNVHGVASEYMDNGPRPSQSRGGMNKSNSVAKYSAMKSRAGMYQKKTMHQVNQVPQNKQMHFNFVAGNGSAQRVSEQEYMVMAQQPSNNHEKFYKLRTEQRKYEPDSDEEFEEYNKRNYFASPQVRREYGFGNSAARSRELDLFNYNSVDHQQQGTPQKLVDGMKMPVVGCMPGCTKTTCGMKKCNHDYDYSKNYMNALNQRPGEFAEYNWLAANYHLLQQEKKGVVCDGIKQTPINLETSVPILENFEDNAFQFKYADIDAQKQLKYNQKGCQYQLIMENKTLNDNYFLTNTIGLFDQNCSCVKLQGLQYHFHAPSEHSINGKLLDLEMHIVHGVVPDPKQPTRFTNGVLGFFFKAVPDNFEFAMHGLSEYHDKFLKRMLVESMSTKQGQPKKPLNLNKFVQEVRYNRRWTYTGSLTTAPFSEGILWNVCEHVIPLRQTTLDMFLDFRRVEQENVFNKFENEHQCKEVEAKLSIQPEQMKPFEAQNGETYFRVAACNRVVQDQGNRPVYHIDLDA